MIEHKHTETTKVNFDALESRLLKINNRTGITCWEFEREFFKSVRFHSRSAKKGAYINPTLILATGGSKASAYYLQMYLESMGIIAEVIEPRDYFYKQNIHCYKRLIAISNNGNSNGIEDALESFEGEKYLFTGNYKDRDNTTVISWSSGFYDNQEKSFISIVPALALMIMILDCVEIYQNNKEEDKTLQEINKKIALLIKKSKEKIQNIQFDFKNENLVQILSGYDTKIASTILESNLVESGVSSVVIHDKGSFCHGRSNLLFQNPSSPMFYLAQTNTNLDKTILEGLIDEYQNVFLLHTFDLEENILWKNFYLSLQMYFLSKKIAEDKNIDLTMPEYNPRLIRKLYNYKGEM